MARENSANKKVTVNLDYLMPDTSFVYPLYSEDGEKLLEEREILTSFRIKSIRERYGNKIYYSLPDDESGIIPEYLAAKALGKTKEVFDEMNYLDKLSPEAYKKSAELIDEILEHLSSTELKAIRLLKDVKNFDDYLYYHSINVGMLTALLVKKRRKYSAGEIKHVVLGAYLCDLGKIKLEKSLLSKPGKLSSDELVKIKLHPQLGYNILKDLDDIDPIVLQTILFHHERYDDEGYYGLPYESLPSSPKIVSICDTYDALTSPRPYRQAYSTSEALKLIVNLIDQKFERSMVGDFLNSMASLLNNSQTFYKKGDFCILNTNELALISNIGAKDVLKPGVIVFARYQKEGEKLSMKFYQHPIEVDLMNDINRYLNNLIVNKKVVDAVREKLVDRRMLLDYLYVPIDENFGQ